MYFIFDGKFEANITNSCCVVTNIFPKKCLDSFTLTTFPKSLVHEHLTCLFIYLYLEKYRT